MSSSDVRSTSRVLSLHGDLALTCSVVKPAGDDETVWLIAASRTSGTGVATDASTTVIDKVSVLQ